MTSLNTPQVADDEDVKGSEAEGGVPAPINDVMLADAPTGRQPGKAGALTLALVDRWCHDAKEKGLCGCL